MTIISTPKKLRSRDAFDYYRTPVGLAVASLEAEVSTTPTLLDSAEVLDPGAGTGSWGAAIRKVYPSGNYRLTGVDIREVGPLPGYDYVERCDFLAWEPQKKFDLVVGNPPFKYAEEFIRKSFSLLNPEAGTIIFLLRTNFLESRKRFEGLWEDLCPEAVLTSVRRISFTEDGRTDDTSYSVYYWQSNYRGNKKVKSYIGGWLDWNYLEEDLRKKYTG